MNIAIQSQRLGIAASPAIPLPFSPTSLFVDGNKGVWWDPSDMNTLFQDTAGTTPVTASGQKVARINDKSGNGYHLVQSNTSFQPTFQDDGNGKRYLYFLYGHRLATASASPIGIKDCGGAFALVQNGTYATGNPTSNAYGRHSRIFSAGPSTGNDYNRNDAMGISTGDATSIISRFSNSTVCNVASSDIPTPLGCYSYNGTASQWNVYNASDAVTTTNIGFTNTDTNSGLLAVGCEIIGGVVVPENSPTGLFEGYWYGHCHVGRTMTAQELTGLRGFLRTKF